MAVHDGVCLSVSLTHTRAHAHATSAESAPGPCAHEGVSSSGRTRPSPRRSLLCPTPGACRWCTEPPRPDARLPEEGSEGSSVPGSGHREQSHHSRRQDSRDPVSLVALLCELCIHWECTRGRVHGKNTNSAHNHCRVLAWPLRSASVPAETASHLPMVTVTAVSASEGGGGTGSRAPSSAAPPGPRRPRCSHSTVPRTETHGDRSALHAPGPSAGSTAGCRSNGAKNSQSQ